MNIMICDDNSIQLEIFKEFFNGYKDKEMEVNYFENGEDAIESCSRVHIDVAFLDIEMKGISGIDVGRTLKEKNMDCILVFVTGYKDHAVSAFKLRALDYLLKPVTDNQLEEIMDEIQGLYKEILSKRLVEKQFVFTTKHEKFRVPYEQIIVFEKVNRKIRLITTEGIFEYLGTFREVIEALDMTLFCQCHQSFIVNKMRIREVIDHEIVIEEFGINVPINRHSRTLVKEMLRDKERFVF